MSGSLIVQRNFEDDGNIRCAKSFLVMPKDADLASSAALFEKAEFLSTLISKFFSCFCVSTLTYTKVRCVFIYYMICWVIIIYICEYEREMSDFVLL